jgi:hypothetical protein
LVAPTDCPHDRPELTRFYAEVRAFPGEAEEPEVAVPGPGDVVVPLRFRHGGQELAFFSTVAVFGTPLDITVDELASNCPSRLMPQRPHTCANVSRECWSLVEKSVD